MKKILKSIFGVALIFALFYGAKFLSVNDGFAVTIDNKSENLYLFSSFLSLMIVFNLLLQTRLRRFLPIILSIFSLVILSCAILLAVFSELGYYSGPMADDVIFLVLLITSGIVFLLYNFKLETEV
ncbi:MAG: hypothetical protein WCY43_00465 [Patescibacteria group bacterium]|nr:hypothetical protein [Patescibacteria group bacterium]